MDLWQLDARMMLVQENQRIQRGSLRTHGTMPLHREIAEKKRYMFTAELTRMPPLVETDIAKHPMQVGFLGRVTQTAIANRFPEQSNKAIRLLW